MEAIFLKVLNMSLSASVLILAVLLLRLILQRAPKWIHCLLFAIAGLRLILPFSFKSILSLIPSADPIPQDIALMKEPAVDTGIPAVNAMINPIITKRFAPDPMNSVNPLQMVQFAAVMLWIVGIIGILVSLLISYLRTKHSVRAAVRHANGAYICDEVRSPFILGLIHPKVYLPSDLSEEMQKCVLLHEWAHTRRGDAWWKLLAFLILSVHWFNPLCWLAYILFCRDIEAACDESVVGMMSRERRAAYSEALLECSRPHRIVSVCPLAFGENNVKNRIKKVLNYRKPHFLIILASLLILSAFGVCFLTNPVRGSILDSIHTNIQRNALRRYASNPDMVENPITKEIQNAPKGNTPEEAFALYFQNGHAAETFWYDGYLCVIGETKVGAMVATIISDEEGTYRVGIVFDRGSDLHTVEMQGDQKTITSAVNFFSLPGSNNPKEVVYAFCFSKEGIPSDTNHAVFYEIKEDIFNGYDKAGLYHHWYAVSDIDAEGYCVYWTEE